MRAQYVNTENEQLRLALAPEVEPEPIRITVQLDERGRAEELELPESGDHEAAVRSFCVQHHLRGDRARTVLLSAERAIRTLRATRGAVALAAVAPSTPPHERAQASAAQPAAAPDSASSAPPSSAPPSAFDAVFDSGFATFDDAAAYDDNGDVQLIDAGFTWRNPIPGFDLGAGYIHRAEVHGRTIPNDSVRVWIQARPVFEVL